MRVEHVQPTFETTLRTEPSAAPPPPLSRVAAADADVVVQIGVPPTPPPEVLERVQEAAERALQMAADDRELHFRKDEESGRVIVEVRDLDGHVIRTIPPSEALSVVSGGSV